MKSVLCDLKGLTFIYPYTSRSHPSQLRDCLLHPDSPLGQPLLTRSNLVLPLLSHPLHLRWCSPACVSPEGYVAFRVQRSLSASFTSAAHRSPIFWQAPLPEPQILSSRSDPGLRSSRVARSIPALLPTSRQRPASANGCVCRLVHSVKVNVLMKR